MDIVKPLRHLSFDGDIAQNWEEWIQQMNLFITAKELDKKPDKVKVAVMLSAMGPDGIARYNQFTWANADDKDKFDSVVQKFENELKGEKRVVFNRYKFWEYTHSEAQPFEDYLNSLKVLASRCEFTEKDNMIRDKIIFSTNDTVLKERLL